MAVKENSTEQPFLGPYQLRQEVGRGGGGAVYRARDPRIGRDVAVKVLNSDISEDADALGSFWEEARIAGQLDHPNVVPVYELSDAAETDNPYLVMKLVRGDSLAEMIEEQRTRQRSHQSNTDDLLSFVEVLLKLCDALSFAHSRGVVHCDLKPENIMVGEHGEVYLMDWGVAMVMRRPLPDAPASSRRSLRARGSGESSARVDGEESSELVHLTHVSRGGFRGTPAHMAPEQLLAREDEIDQRTDVFGLGGVLFTILTGEPPNVEDGLLARAINMEPLSMEDRDTIWPELPPGLVGIATKALSARRDDRYGSIGEMRRALEQFLRGGGWFASRHYSAGEFVVREGEQGNEAFIIESGQCDVFKTLAGEQCVVRRLSAGEVFGETAVLTGASRTASVVAVGDVTLKVITAESLNRELDRNPWLALFVRSLASLFREADSRLSAPPAQRTPE